jgi:Bacterial Ig-like domain (group 2)
MRSYPLACIGVLCALAFCSLLLGCGGSNSTASNQSSGAPKLSQIKISPANKSIAKGTSLQFIATGIFSDGTQQDFSASASWKASPAIIATISAHGNLTGVGEGAAQVSATYQGLSGSASITVGPPALMGIAVSLGQSSLPLGGSENVIATGSFSDGSTQDLTRSVSWQANPSTVATIGNQGILTGVGKGVAQVSATYQGLSGSASLTVGSAVLVGIGVSLQQSTLPLGASESATATGNFSDGTTQNLTSLAAWQTNASTVATISPQGNLTGIGKGSAQISATYQGLSGSASLTVGSAALIGIVVSLQQASLPVGESESATATGIFSDGTRQNLTQSVTWSLSGPAIASVSPTGAVLAEAVGSAILSASAASVTGSANLSVTSAAIVALNITPVPPLIFGNSTQLQAIATFSDGTTKDVTTAATWSSEQPDIVDVSSGGLATADHVGSATVLAQNSGVTGSAVITVTPLITVSYFNRARAVASGVDSTVQLINPGSPPQDMCAMIYVFDDSQEMNECCGCKISPDGLRTLSLLTDLTANTLTGRQLTVGTLMIVSSNPDPSGQCDAGSPVPNGLLPGWVTNVQGTLQNPRVTEIPTAISPLADAEAQALSSSCGFIQTLGSGRGICSCGTGN